MEETKHREKSDGKVEQSNSQGELNAMRRQLDTQDSLIKAMKKELDFVREENQVIRKENEDLRKENCSVRQLINQVMSMQQEHQRLVQEGLLGRKEQQQWKYTLNW